ncbi:hypothetical protein EV702DRAFT_1136563 [Suillus placidus]|uniref:Uncharacterized protein n=1 Tax=Suillus placidus TaxID=48579 RepID=A0A9P6ZMT6_9AGAM|nr:hypothetical protein EV702DRAFT_1136563 [Suillus placidus]
MLGASSNRLSTPSDVFELDASPAKNTRSHKRTVVPPPPVLESPTKKRRVKADDTDLDIWDKNDDDIISTSKARWNSAAYDHYKISLKRRLKADGSPDYLEFEFVCRSDPVNHKPHHRKRMQTAQGTKNLNRGVKECIQRRGISTQGPDATGAQQTLSSSVSKYTPQAHRALIAMRCAVNKRPFNFVFHSSAHLVNGLSRVTKKTRPTFPSLLTLWMDISTAPAFLKSSYTLQVEFFSTGKMPVPPDHDSHKWHSIFCQLQVFFSLVN